MVKSNPFPAGLTYLNKPIDPAGRIVGFADLDFDTAEVLCHSSDGTPYIRRILIGMPKIPPRVVNCVFYLYETREDAETGTNKQGTGFIVALRSAVQSQIFPYFVTNKHVAEQGASVVRIDKYDGTHSIFDYDCVEWESLPHYDIAVHPAPLGDEHNFTVVQEGMFLTKERKEKEQIGPGDDVFMVGLFVDYEDSSIINAPFVRFGNISSNPIPIRQPEPVNCLADSYCLDMRSRKGYSGSPVFVYRTPGYDLEEIPGSGDQTKLLTSGRNHLSFLGIHYGQFPEIWEVASDGKLKDQESKKEHKELLTDGRYIKGLSGMTCVLPAWSILEVLDIPKLKSLRDDENVELVKKFKNAPMPE